MYTINDVEKAKIAEYRKALALVFPQHKIRKETFCFTGGNGIGTVVEVEFTMYSGDKYKYNVTDYHSW